MFRIFPKQEHVPVLLSPIVRILENTNIKRIVDCTFGGGGYTREFASKYDVIGIDRDASALKSFPIIPTNTANVFGTTEIGRVRLMHRNFENLSGFEQTDALVYDLGLNTAVLPTRGFSFRIDSLLDMRMDTNDRLTAYEIVNDWDLDRIAQVLLNGEEPKAYAIAREIINKRQKQKITTSLQLADLICDVKGWKGRSGMKHPATVPFQAIRMEVNNELQALWSTMIEAERILQEGALVFIVTFHSLEDRLVKKFFNSCRQGHQLVEPISKLVKRDGGKYHKMRVQAQRDYDAGIEYPVKCWQPPSFVEYCKLIKPSHNEIFDNPRSRSAKLRVYKRTANQPIYS